MSCLLSSTTVLQGGPTKEKPTTILLVTCILSYVWNADIFQMAHVTFEVIDIGAI